MFGRLRHMMIKEFIQVFRDKRLLMVLSVAPIFQVIVFGYAAILEVKHIPAAVLDYDNSQVSRDLISRFEASRYFDIRKRLTDTRQIPEVIDRGEATMAIRINAGFAQNIRKGQTAHIQVIVDSANSNTALIGLGYLNAVTGHFIEDYQLEALARKSPFATARMPKIVLENRPWYNTEMSSQWFFVPGIIGNMVFATVVILTAFAIVREREVGTLEQIMVTPLRRVEFILGKSVPFFLIGGFNATVVSIVGTLWFNVPMRGGLVVLALGTMLFLMSVLGIGLFISTVSRTQQQAMVTAFFLLMPVMIFSGFGSPISSMPDVLQYLAYLNPLKYYQTVLRSIYLKGVGLDVLWPEMAAMTGIGIVMLAFSVMRFKKSLE